MADLPNAKQLERLTLRAIAAYAVRSARRGSAVLRGVIEDDVIEAPLRIAEMLASQDILDLSSAPAAPLSVASVARTMSRLHTPQLKVAALCLTRAGMAMTGIFLAARLADSEQGKNQRAYAAKEAADCANSAADAIDGPAALDVINSACRDYYILLKNFGEHDEVVLGEPIDLSNDWWQGQGASV